MIEIKKKNLLIVGIALIVIILTAIIFIPHSNIKTTSSKPIKVIDGDVESILIESLKYSNNDLNAEFYDKDTKTKILEFDLKSHPSVDYVKQVPSGNQVVMWYDIYSNYSLEDALGNVKFINMKNGKEINRNYEFVYWGDESYESPVYNYVTNSNGSKSYIQTGTETLIRKVWLPYKSKNIPEGQTRIGIRVEVKDYDYVDGIWTIGGNEIDKHASWNAPVTDAHGVGYEATGSSSSKLGATIFTQSSKLNLTVITKGANTTATTCYVRNNTGTQIATGTFIGSDCAITGGVVLAPITTYRIEADSGGGSYTRDRFVIPPAVAGTNINWTAGSLNGAYDGSSAYNILSITTATELVGINISIISPSNDTNYTTNIINFSGNATENGATLLNNVSIEVWNMNTGTLSYNTTNTSAIAGIYNFTSSALTDGNYNWTLHAYDDSNLLYNSTTRTFKIDTKYPQINISSLTNGTNYDYLINNQNLTLNVTPTDNNLDTCWYDYNFTNTTFSCTNATLSSNNFAINNNTNITVYVNDTLGQTNGTMIQWTFSVFDFDNYTYTSPVSETDTTTFTGEFQTSSALTNYSLFYNGTNHSANLNILDTNIYSISSSAQAPVVSTNTNITWYFWINDINATSKNQTVANVLIDDCSSYAYPVFNFTLYDEEHHNTQLTDTTIKYGLNFYNSEGDEVVTSVNGTNYTNPFLICSQSALTTNFRLNGSLQYYSNQSSSDYSIRYYNFLNHLVSNQTVQENFSLYDVNSTKVLPFLLTFRNSNLALHPNALVQVYKQYLEDNDFKIVEIPLTDSNGQAILNLERNTAVYNIIMIDVTGSVIASFNNIVAFCQDYTIGSCSIDLSAGAGGELSYNYNTDVGISYTISYQNSTNKISLTFTSLNSSNQNVKLVVKTQNQFENETVCINSLTATSGTVTCDISSDVNTNQFFFSEILVNNNLISTEVLNTNPSLSSKGGYFGTNGFFLAFLFMIFIVLIFSNDKQVLVIGIGIGWVLISILGLIKGALIGVSSAGIWLIVTIVIFLWKLGEEEKG